MTDRIFFKDNPWPAGHGIKQFVWSGRLEPDSGIWFDLHLESEDYDEEDEEWDVEEELEKEDWESKLSWTNYYRCILSSIYWGYRGLLVGTEQKNLDMSLLDQEEFVVDSLSVYDFEDPAFHIYLLGHDAVADHHIRFQRTSHEFSITWSGKIALAYVGEHEFKHSFEVKISKATLKDIYVPAGMKDDEAQRLLEKFVVDSHQFRLKRKEI